MTGSHSDSHEDFDREEDVAHSSNRSFGLTFTAVFLVLAALSWWRDGDLWPYFGGIALGFLAAALLVPNVLARLNRLWARFGLLLHRVVNPVVMGLLFFLTITPIGLVMRLAGKDFLRLRFDPAAPSYWIDRVPPGPAPESMRNQY
ncbi:MAG: SxtJ family membrane protein [Dongiaceae bacterium]